ncbi:ribonuclease E/G [Hyphomonas pacifica]|uniref:RNA-binding protein AU-1/Ribonuclease E/G domain-containing protein n=1 Tax=Hyphomonas pacifica TaxID=1280941 RepID=A0A062TXU1_9PROT|nr:ribonuclease E/G [Hyphomonas pacifica]KCZ50313.1 hypothetical protein HY2_14280 [Hyphomonas pacifica]RAN32586.1 hypothetical protein HY3_14760 [Hyphomonas pacifica]
MTHNRILREVCIGETREVLLNQHGLAIALRLSRWSDQDSRLTLGSVHEARLRTLEPALEGAFIEILGKGEAFLRLPKDNKLTEGQAITIQVAAEARNGKLPRVIAHAKDRASEDASLTLWHGAVIEDVRPGDPEVAEAFETALAPSVQIPNGGRLHIERTTALCAVDIDTSGRIDKGSAASRALRINKDSCTELARQIGLRQLGGLFVVDCVAPINRESGRKLQEATQHALISTGIKGANILPPSSLGLMEMSLPWKQTPIAERILRPGLTQPTPESLCLAGLRLLEAEAAADRLQRVTLQLPAEAHLWFTGEAQSLQEALAGKYGQRFTYEASTNPTPNVYRTL